METFIIRINTFLCFLFVFFFLLIYYMPLLGRVKIPYWLGRVLLFKWVNMHYFGQVEMHNFLKSISIIWTWDTLFDRVEIHCNCILSHSFLCFLFFFLLFFLLINLFSFFLCFFILISFLHVTVWWSRDLLFGRVQMYCLIELRFVVWSDRDALFDWVKMHCLI